MTEGKETAYSMPLDDTVLVREKDEDSDNLMSKSDRQREDTTIKIAKTKLLSQDARSTLTEEEKSVNKDVQNVLRQAD